MNAPYQETFLFPYNQACFMAEVQLIDILDRQVCYVLLYTLYILLYSISKHGNTP